MTVYDDFKYPNQPDIPLIRLARHIFSVAANSASCEQLFSAFGNTLTKLRNRLSTNTMTALTDLKMYIKDENRKGDYSRRRLKRHFGARLPSQPAPTLPFHKMGKMIQMTA